MPVIIAKIKSKKESIEIVKRALIEIAKYVNKNEKGTLNYFITQDNKEKNIFFTYEKFLSHEDMEIHNSSEALKKFLEATKGHLEKDINIFSGNNIEYI